MKRGSTTVCCWSFKGDSRFEMNAEIKFKYIDSSLRSE